MKEIPGKFIRKRQSLRAVNGRLDLKKNVMGLKRETELIESSHLTNFSGQKKKIGLADTKLIFRVKLSCIFQNWRKK